MSKVCNGIGRGLGLAGFSQAAVQADCNCRAGLPVEARECNVSLFTDSGNHLRAMTESKNGDVHAIDVTECIVHTIPPGNHSH